MLLRLLLVWQASDLASLTRHATWRSSSVMLVGGVACTDCLWVWAAVGTGTGRIAPDLARRRFKAMVKGLFKASSKPITYKVPTQ